MKINQNTILVGIIALAILVPLGLTGSLFDTAKDGLPFSNINKQQFEQGEDIVLTLTSAENYDAPREINPLGCALGGSIRTEGISAINMENVEIYLDGISLNPKSFENRIVSIQDGTCGILGETNTGYGSPWGATSDRCFLNAITGSSPISKPDLISLNKPIVEYVIDSPITNGTHTLGIKWEGSNQYGYVCNPSPTATHVKDYYSPIIYYAEYDIVIGDTTPTEPTQPQQQNPLEQYGLLIIALVAIGAFIVFSRK